MEQWDEEPSDISPNILFRKNEGELAKAKRIAIRPSDTNILCGKNWNNTENVPDLIKYQVGKFVELLNCHLSPMENIVLDTNDWTIPHLEVYWDLYHKDAHDYYHHTLKERLEEVIQCGSYLSVPTEKDGNLTIVKCNLYNDRSDDRISPQIQLSFYPKAKNRIRVEVKYIGSIRSLIQNRMKNLRNRYSLAALPEVIDNALSYATDTAQQFLSQLDMHDSPSRSIPNTFAMLSHRLYKEGAESQIITNRIIGKILHNNNISVDGETREAIQRLVISGVLRRVISRKRKAKSEPYYYTYTTMFAPIFRALRKEMKRK
ncbi:MAG: hypothetical protein PQ612_10510 [Rickettsiales bacterium]|nr:hypothetical protein [Rickettsiales bacterium]MDG4548708.1 hypothetical protein [Rickettsiales bacterium]